MDMNWNFMSSSVWLNMVAARFRVLARRAVAAGAAADVAVAVSSSMPFL